MSSRFFTVRLSINQEDFAATVTYRAVLGQDVEEAERRARSFAVSEFNRGGWILDGCEEEAS